MSIKKLKLKLQGDKLYIITLDGHLGNFVVRSAASLLFCSECYTFECQEVLVISPSSIYKEYLQENKIKRVDCPSCGCCIALNFTGDWIPLEEILISDDGKDYKHGWIEAQTSKEKEVHYVLSQILYLEHDTPNADLNEAVYDLPDQTDVVKILWDHGYAVGFYTVKPKGTMIEETMDVYAMHTLDTAYIQKPHRRRGHGISLIADLIKSYPEEDIGFSKPISHSMFKVVGRFLNENVAARKRLWEVEGPGGEGNQKLIWFSFLQQQRRTAK